MASSGACSTKWHPKFDNELEYENWKNAMEYGVNLQIFAMEYGVNLLICLS